MISIHIQTGPQNVALSKETPKVMLRKNIQDKFSAQKEIPFRKSGTLFIWFSTTDLMPEIDTVVVEIFISQTIPELSDELNEESVMEKTGRMFKEYMQQYIAEYHAKELPIHVFVQSRNKRIYIER